MTRRIAATLQRCEPATRTEIMRSVPERSLRALNAHFPEWAHPGQLQPEGDWRTWVLMAGRGWGKTRAGAEWVLEVVRASTALGMSGSGKGKGPSLPFETSGRRPRSSSIRIALVAASLDEARRVMVEGPSGILSVARGGEVAEWSFARRRLLFANGAEATLFSGAHPEGLRGPEHDFAWCDELAKWAKPDEAWDNLQLGLRRGDNPRALVTTTPRRVAALRRILGEEGVVVTGGASGENPHLPRAWVAAMARSYGESALGRQELGGELLDEATGALWTRALIERCRVVPFDAACGVAQDRLRDASSTGSAAPQDERMVRTLVGVDPPAGEGVCGIVAVGLGDDGAGYVLGDHSAGGLTPAGWAARVAAAAEIHGAGGVVAEANQGGAMVRAVLEGAGLRLPVLPVHAREGKAARAAPVAALFEAGRAKLAGRFPALEDELAGLCADGRYEGPGRSPDRADAMVWAFTRLMLGGGGGAPAVARL